MTGRLGAEISLGWFQEPFIGKTIFDGKEFKSITVVKGGAKEDDMHGVDGISGGTITSDGVSDMLDERLSKYLPFFNQKLSEMIEADTVVVDSLQALTLNTIK